MELADDIRELILNKRSGPEVRRAARKHGMGSLREDAIDKLVAGKTSLKEINKVTFVENIL